MLGRKKKQPENLVPSSSNDMNLPDEEMNQYEGEPLPPHNQPVPVKKRTPKQTKTLSSSPRDFYDSKLNCENCGREFLMKIPIGVRKVTYILQNNPICKLCQCPIVTIQVEEPEESGEPEDNSNQYE